MKTVFESWEITEKKPRKSTEQMREWRKKNPERAREQTLKAVKKYYDAWKKRDPEGYAEHMRIVNRKSMRRKRQRMLATMTPEEREAEKAWFREKYRKQQEKKKAQEAAAQAEQNKGTD